MAYARRVDATQAAIVDALRKTGWLVYDASRFGGGFPDLVLIKHGRTTFAEVKDGSKPPSAQKLTPAEAELHEEFLRHGAEVVILTSIEQAVRL